MYNVLVYAYSVSVRVRAFVCVCVCLCVCRRTHTKDAKKSSGYRLKLLNEITPMFA